MKLTLIFVASLFTLWGLFADRFQWDSLFWPWSDFAFWALLWVFLYMISNDKTALSKDQMKGALLLPGVVILLAVSMYFVGFLIH